MANALPLGHRKLVNPPPYPGGGPSGIHLILPLSLQSNSTQFERALEVVYSGERQSFHGNSSVFIVPLEAKASL